MSTIRAMDSEERSSAGQGTLVAIGCAALGAGLMYMLDPQRGTRRRARVRDQLIHLRKQTGRGLSRAAIHLRGWSRGAAARMRGGFTGGAVPDEQLVGRVRAALGHAIAHASAIQVTAHQGRVGLRGAVLAAEAPVLLSTVRSVRGVSGIVNQLQVHHRPGALPQLQGEGRRRGRRYRLARESWPREARLIAAAGGCALAAWGITRRGGRGIAGLLLGTGLLMRAITNLSPRRLLALEPTRRPVGVHKILHIAAPATPVFAFFSNYQNFPHFMSNIRQVRDHGTGRSHWVVKGPAGMDVEWDADLTRYIPDRVIAWRSVPNATVANAGIIRFEPAEDGGTRVHIQLSYSPPAGKLGHAIARLFGADPKHEMDQDLARIKTWIETGRPARDAAQPIQIQPNA